MNKSSSSITRIIRELRTLDKNIEKWVHHLISQIEKEMETNQIKQNEMKKLFESNQKLYKSIVIGMTLLLPVGIGFGIAQNNIPAGLLAGNLLGFILGIIYHTTQHKNKGCKLYNQC
jgi:F0F1-type ATP synthase assembly protein I